MIFLDPVTEARIVLAQANIVRRVEEQMQPSLERFRATIAEIDLPRPF